MITMKPMPAVSWLYEEKDVVKIYGGEDLAIC